MGLYWVKWDASDTGECSTDRPVPHITLDDVFEVMGEVWIYPISKGMGPFVFVREAKASEVGSMRPVNDPEEEQ